VTVTDTAGPDYRAALARNIRREIKERRKTGAPGWPFELPVALEGKPFNSTGALPRWNEEEARRNVRLALDRMGASDESKARWLLSFAAVDLTRLLPGQRLDLGWEILAFVLPPSSEVMKVPVDRHGEIQVPVESLHAWLHKGVRQLQGPSPSWRLSTRTTLELLRHGHRLYAVSWGGDDALTRADRFEAEVARVLSSLRARFRFCRNCGQPFIARKRQAYCRQTCSQTFRTRKYRAKDPDRAREQRRRAYEQSVRETHGPNVRIQHRTLREQQARRTTRRT